MLLLSRKLGDRIVIDGGITLVVHRISGNRVVIGIQAPEEVSVRRGELEPLPSIAGKSGGPKCGSDHTLFGAE